MFFDRIIAKREARGIIASARPRPVLVTLVYLLMTSGISYLLGWLVADPFMESLDYMIQGYDPFEVYAYVFGGGAATLAIFLNVLFNCYSVIADFGYSSYILHLSRGEDGDYRDLLDGFTILVKVVVLNILKSLIVTVGFMCFVLPGIIFSYSYSQAVYCLLDAPDISPIEAMRRSRGMMRGQKLNLFIVEFSFFGWSILAAVAANLVGFFFGDGGFSLTQLAFNLWLTPYTNLVAAMFYNNLTGWNRQSSYGGPTLEF